VAVVTPDATNIMLTATGTQARILKGLPCLLGLMTGNIVMSALFARSIVLIVR